ncbi:phage tail protein [Magnetospirillum gryphiswaldense]|uniref:Phage Tail Collar n=1 Tax=Magnetospirillum gryphiswaldense TaxID=55518 RepID=A4TXJ5_9PROT|nr:tail fiber protein [Magnetospirillum gryphiswaldense]AVM75439.1 Phage Tail Collar Domain protein [Magnetospirillum gryphiswaldense MSR-1]AVM79342.1 Phage Tail Collar Domain protein [Magnetospirillum gryphiswaldense]CAM75352.1 Phage Tail Collar [Magnetospirillum gryphiswaldense MSR-1]
MKINPLLPTTTLAVLIVAMAAGKPAHACNGESPLMGEVCAVAFNYCPESTLPADGRKLAISEYQALFALIGTQFGGDGSTNFALPNLNGRSIVGANLKNGAPAFAVAGGQESVALTAAQVPAHTHAASLTASLTVTPQVVATQGLGNNPVAQSGNKLSTNNGSAGFTTANFAAYTTPATAGTTVALGGVSNTFSGSGQVTVNPTGASQPVATIPPQLALQFCVTVTGLYPERP